MDVSKVFFVLHPVYLTRNITSMLVHIRADVLLPLDIKSQSKNEKLIWISPVVSWRMLLGLYVKKHWERWFIWSLRNWLFNINLKWKPLARSVAMVWKLKFQQHNVNFCHERRFRYLIIILMQSSAHNLRIHKCLQSLICKENSI